MQFLEEHVHFVVLHWVRCLALLGTMSAFGNTAAARTTKVALGVMLGTMLSFADDPASFTHPETTGLLVLLVVKEFMIGALFGFVTNIIFDVAAMAGQLVGEEMGFNMASITDPVTGRTNTVMAQVYQTIAVVSFFAADGHLFVVRSLARSFHVYRVDALSFSTDLLAATVLYASTVFIAAIELAAPVFMAMLILGVVLAILAKVAPELQLMDFAYPAKAAAGLGRKKHTSRPACASPTRGHGARRPIRTS